MREHATSEPNINRPMKRPLDEISKTEVSDMFEQLVKQQEKRFTAIINEVRDGIRIHTEQNKDISGSIDFLGKKYDAMLARIDVLEKEKFADRKYIQSLESRLEQAERSLRSSSIEVRNVPKKSGETKADLMDLVKNIGSALNVPVQKTDIRDVYRINNKSENQPIIAEFTSVMLKESIVGSTKVYNKTYKTSKFSTSNLKIQGPSKPVFISECLPAKTKKLFFLAREFAKQNGYKYCWTTRGQVYLRRADGSSLVKINNESDLEALMVKWLALNILVHFYFVFCMLFKMYIDKFLLHSFKIMLNLRKFYTFLICLLYIFYLHDTYLYNIYTITNHIFTSKYTFMQYVHAKLPTKHTFTFLKTKWMIIRF